MERINCKPNRYLATAYLRFVIYTADLSQLIQGAFALQRSRACPSKSLSGSASSLECNSTDCFATTTIKEIIDKNLCPFPLLAGSLYQCRSLYQRSSLWSSIQLFRYLRSVGLCAAIILNAVSCFHTRKIVADQEPAPRVLAYILGGVVNPV